MNFLEVWSPVSVISTMWPSRFSLRGLISVAPSLPGLAAVRVVGAGHVDLAGVQARLDVLAAVHLGGAHLVRGQAGVDEHFLDGHAGNHGLAVDHQGQPFAGAVEGAVGRNRALAVDLGGRGVCR